MADANAAGDFRVLIVGTASVSLENNELATHDLEQGERVGVPIAVLILVALFGAVAAALVPIGLSIIRIIAALGLVAIIGQTFELLFFRHAHGDHDWLGGRHRLLASHHFPFPR